MESRVTRIAAIVTFLLASRLVPHPMTILTHLIAANISVSDWNFRTDRAEIFAYGAGVTCNPRKRLSGRNILTYKSSTW